MSKSKRKKYGLGTEDPIIPLGGPQFKSANPTMTLPDSELPRMTAPVQPIYKINPQGEVIHDDGTPLVGLSQYSAKTIDEYGNTVLNPTGNYVSETGQVNTKANQQRENDAVSAQNRANASKYSRDMENTEKLSMLAVSGINSILGKSSTAKANRISYRDALLNNQKLSTDNVYLDGTGSQAIMKNGGRIKYPNGGEIDPTPDLMKRKTVMNDWNGFVDFLDKKGLKGSPKLNSNQFRDGVFAEYRKAYPNSNITPDIVPTLQKEFIDYRNYAVDQVKTGKAVVAGKDGKPMNLDQLTGQFGQNLEGLWSELSQVDGLVGEKTSKWKFPTLYMQTIDGQTGALMKTENKGVQARGEFADGGEIGGGDPPDSLSILPKNPLPFMYDPNKPKTTVSEVPGAPPADAIPVRNRRKQVMGETIELPDNAGQMQQFPKRHVQGLIQAANEVGINPSWLLGVAMRETSLKMKQYGLTNGDPNLLDVNERKQLADIQKRTGLNGTYVEAALILKNKMNYAKSLGYNDPATMIQLYNGTKLKRDPKTYPNNKAYGVDIPVGGIDLTKNPLYGKDILKKAEMYNNLPQVRELLKSSGATTYANGGEIEGQAAGVQTLDGGKTEVVSTSDHSNPMVEFKGRTHDEGGIGIQYGNSVAEVEDKEVGWIDSEGGLNIFGKLKVPGTNQTFRKAAKDIAKLENDVDNRKAKYLKILNGGDQADPYQKSAISTAKVMFKSLDKQSKEIAEKKEALASYQNLILQMHQGGNQYKMGGEIFAENGAVIDKKPTLTDEEIGRLMKAIAKHESGGNYKRYGNSVIQKGEYKGQRALGKYQIMPGNLKAWTKEALGRSVPVDEFMADEGIQDEVAAYHIKKLADQYGKAEDVASAWFSGGPLHKRAGTNDGNSSTPKYVADVMNIYSGGKWKKSDYTYTKPNGETGGWGNWDTPSKKNTEITTGGGFPTQFSNVKTFKAPQGLNPQVFYKDPDVVKSLQFNKANKAVTDGKWGEKHQAAWDALPQAKKDELIKASGSTGSTAPAATPATASNNNSTTTTTDNSMNYTPRYAPVETKPVSEGKETQYGKAHRDPTKFVDNVNIGNSDRKRGFISPLAIEQIAPELLTLATNKKENVNAASYDPQLKQTFDLSYQSGRNENQSTFNQVAKIAEMTGNPEALSLLAAQKYKADEQYNLQEVQGNAAQKLQTYNTNADVINDARIKNLALFADQQMKQAQADFNTRREDIGAIGSMAAKVQQNKLENTTYNAYASLFKHYGFDKNGNVTFNPDNVTQRFTAGEAQQYGMLAAQKGVADLSKMITKDKNSDGSSTTKISNTTADDLDKALDLKKKGAKYVDIIKALPSLEGYDAIKD